MTVRSLNGLNGTSTGVVITNRMEAQLPLEQTQATFLDPITIAMKGLNGFGGAGKVIKVNSSNNALEYADDINEVITATLPLLRTGDDIALKGISGFTGAGKIIKINSNNDGLEYATDEGSNWTLNGSSLYPLATSTNVLIGSTTNTNSSKFFVNGTSEFNNDVVINNGSAESRLLIGTNSFSGNGSLVVYNPTGAGLVVFSPTQGQANRISLRGTSNTGSDEARITFDPMVGSAEETYLRFQYADKYFFDKQIIIDTTGAELSNGTNTYTLPSSSGTLALTSDIFAGYWSLPVFGSNALVPTDDDYFIQLQKQTDSTFETLLEFYNINQFTDYQYFRFSMNDDGTNGKLKFDSERNSTITNVYEILDAGYMAFNKAIEIKDTVFQFTAPNGNNFSFPTSGGSGILATTNLIPTVPTNNNQLTNGAGYITASSSDVLTNKSISYSQITGTPTTITNNNQLVNGAGFITASSTNTLTNKSISYSQITGTPTTITNNNQLVNGAGFITNSGNESISVNNLIGANDSGNNIASNSSYGWEFRGTDNRQISFPGYTYYAFLGSSSTYSYLININNIGDAYKISGTSTSNLTHNFTGKIQVNTIEAVNESSNTIVSNSSYGWEFRGTSTRYNISFPNGTYYPFLGTETSNPYFIHINNIGDAYQISGTSTSTLTHTLLGQTIIDGASTNPALKFQTGSTVYLQSGRTSTFPSSNMGGTWDGVSVPIGNAYYQGGANTNDGEGFWFCQNGQTTAFSSTADLKSMRWYDEDSITTGWYIERAGGSAIGFSDRRMKTDIIDYKNSCFEKYSKIRTVRYKYKIPDTINPERLTKQSCIDLYNDKYYGIIAQEIYELYPELNICCEVRDKKKWDYRKDNWEKGVYEEEHKQWLIDKEKFECENQEEGKECCYKQKEPQKIFDEEEPILRFDYNRLNIITIGVVQDLIKENETLRTELDTYKSLMDKLINAKSFAEFKKNIA